MTRAHWWQLVALPVAGISALMQRSGTDLTTVLRNVAADVRNVRATSFAAGPALSMLSSISGGSYSTAVGDWVIKFGTVLETETPPACTVGYDEVADVIARHPLSRDLNPSRGSCRRYSGSHRADV